MHKRSIPKKPTKHYKKLIKKCLHPKSRGTIHWGCLHKNGKLFKISTLSHIVIPKTIIQELVKKGSIKLTDVDYYEWVTKKRKKRKKH